MQVTRDYTLAKARAALLDEWYSVITCSLEEAWTNIQRADYDGAVLCSSVAWKDCLPLAEHLAAHSPSIVILRVSEPVIGPGAASVVFVPPFAPPLFIEAVQNAFAPLDRRRPRATPRDPNRREIGRQ